MFKEKAKNFYEKHKTAIIAVGGAIVAIGAVALVASSDNKPDRENKTNSFGNWINKPNDDDLRLSEEYHGEFMDGSSVPTVSKEEASRFMEEKGDIYQISEFDDFTSCIWISKSSDGDQGIITYTEREVKEATNE